MSAHTLLAQASQKLNQAGIPLPWQEAEDLLAHVLKLNRLQLKTQQDLPLSEEARRQFLLLLERRLRHEPFAYIVQEIEFLGQRIKTTPQALIPRPETEILVEHLLKLYAGLSLTILDLCTGSGCIARLLHSHLTHSFVFASDLSFDALNLAQKNTEVPLFLGDCMQALKDHSVDLIICNPPYLDFDLKASMLPDVLDYEPHLALFAEEGGLDLIRRILSDAHRVLKNKGQLWLEIGHNHSLNVQKMAVKSGYEIWQVLTDYASIERFVGLEKKN